MLSKSYELSVYNMQEVIGSLTETPKTFKCSCNICHNQATGVCNPAYSCACPKPG